MGHLLLMLLEVLWPLLVSTGLEAATTLLAPILEAALTLLEVVAVVVRIRLELALLAVVVVPLVRLATVAVVGAAEVLLGCSCIRTKLATLNTIAAEIEQQANGIDQREQIRILRPHVHHSLTLVRSLVELLLKRDAPTLPRLAEIHYEPPVLEELARGVLLGVPGRLTVLEADEAELGLGVQLGVVDLAEVTKELFEFWFGG